MKKYKVIICILFLINVSFTQQFKFGWITDLHVGSPAAEEDLIGVVNDVNLRRDIEFVVATGDITEKGRNAELEKAKEILDKLKVPYYIIPGNHDTKWSESGCTKFQELWGDDKFNFEKHGIKFIGVNSGIVWRGGGGHIEVEDLQWLDSLSGTFSKNQEVYFFVHHEPDAEIDNNFKLTNILAKTNVKAIFVGHEHVNKLLSFNGLPGVMSRSTLSKGKSWGYTLVESRKDSLLFYEVTTDTVLKMWGGISKTEKLSYKNIDSTQFENYNAKIFWKKELNATLSVHPFCANEKIYTATKEGVIYCIDIKGNILWKYDTQSTIVSRPTVESGILVAGTIDGDLYALDAENGKMLQVLGIGEAITSQIVTIPLKLNNEKTFGVVFGTSTGKVFCYELYSFNPVWENKSAGMMIETKPIFSKDRIIYGSWDNYLYCIDATTGFLNWKWTENKNFYYSPAACMPVSDGKNVYVSTPDKYVSAIDVLLGKTVWRKNEFNSWESIGLSKDNQKVLVKSFMNKFCFVNSTNGKLIKEVDVKYGLDTMPDQPLEYNGKIIFGSKNGKVYLINENFSVLPLLFTGTARVHSIQQVKDNMFAATNMDGTIVVFGIQ